VNVAKQIVADCVASEGIVGSRRVLFCARQLSAREAKILADIPLRPSAMATDISTDLR